MPTNAILFVAQVPNSNDRRTVSHVGQAPDRGQNFELGCAEVRCEVCICVIEELVQLAAFVTQ